MCRLEQEAKELFGEMRMLTKEEIELRERMYASISTYTGINFWDLLNDEKDYERSYLSY